MFKKVGISIFLLYYLAFMVLPNIPLVQYYYGQTKYARNEPVIANNDSQVLVGDICYIKALMDRTNQNNEANKDTAPPESNNGGNNLTYMVSELARVNSASNIQDIKFQNHMELLTYRYLHIPSPPPKSIS